MRWDVRGGRWIWALAAICAVALGIRVGYVLGWRDVSSVGGDAGYYHDGANLLADGHGFVHPDAWRHDVRIPGADHPPAYIVALAVPSLLGFDSIRAHMITSCLIGTATVALIGLLGRRIGGDKVGLLAAVIAAGYPNLWLFDGSLMSETLATFFAVLVSLAAYRVWDRPTWRRWAALGAAIGLAALTRSESVLLLGLLLVPLAAWARGLAGWRERVTRAGVAVVAAAAVMAPWVGANLVRFDHPVTLSSQAGLTLYVANCDDTYYGQSIGRWSGYCLPAIGDAGGSVADQRLRSEALDYVQSHLHRFPLVEAARVGRTWGLYAPRDELSFDRMAEGRPLEAARAGLAMYYVLAAFSVAGIVTLRRRGVPSFPLTVWLVNVTITVLSFYGITRFRAAAEPALVLLAAVGLLAVLEHHRHMIKAMSEEPAGRRVPATVSG